MPTITLPNNWRPRPYQRPLWDYLENGGKRAVAIWHRRAGKDAVLLNRAAVASFERVGSRWHCMPEYSQARKAIWDMVNPHTGVRIIDEAFPPEIRENTSGQEMFIRFKNGSTWQLIGSDRYNATVGASPVEITYSEYAIANPAAWDYHRPMLEENNGAASFITTPRGRNHAQAIYDLAVKDPAWFGQRLSVHDTGALAQEQLARIQSELIALRGEDVGKAIFAQEYECSFVGVMIGAYLGAEMARAEEQGRIIPFEIDRSKPVHTVWDLGKTENNPIGCFQVINGLPRLVDFYLPETDDLADWCKWLDDQGYHGNDYVPHDIMHTNWGQKRTRLDMLRDYGRNPRQIAKVSVADGLQAARTTINTALFRDCEGVRHWIDGIKNYRREWSDDLRAFRATPVKDWAEHIGSMTRYFGLAWRDLQEEQGPADVLPKELIYEADEHGRIRANMTLMQQIEAKSRRDRLAAE